MRALLCPQCGQPSDAPDNQIVLGNYVCRSCNAARIRKHRAQQRALGIPRQHSPGRYNATASALRHERYKRDPELHARLKARSLTRAAVRRGTIARLPCQVCGASKVEAHHSDYAKPLEVQWLCRSHHAALHANERASQQSKAGTE